MKSNPLTQAESIKSSPTKKAWKTNQKKSGQDFNFNAYLITFSSNLQNLSLNLLVINNFYAYAVAYIK